MGEKSYGCDAGGRGIERQREEVSAVGVHAGAGFAQVTGGGDMVSGESEAHAGCVVVDALVLASSDLVGFVPDAYRAVGAHAAVEGCPRGEMVGVAGLGVGDEMVEAAPVLSDHDSAPIYGGMGGEEAGFRIGIELAEHRAHGCGGGNPFVKGQQAVDAHADEEDYERAFDAGGVTAGEDFGHRKGGPVS